MEKVTKSKNIKFFPLQFSVTGHDDILILGRSKSWIVPFWHLDFDVCVWWVVHGTISPFCVTPGSWVQALTRQQSPQQALCWWAHPASLHCRDRELGRGGLEIMPFFIGGDHVLLRHWKLSRVWAKPEPRAANRLPQSFQTLTRWADCKLWH